mmetsp:Transcript_20693/g.54743  ORF Transcript_20693/g.54743 Transcript_20693/m.54743 type:complete len:385 (-) Transcript_20693:208-1362(-)
MSGVGLCSLLRGGEFPIAGSPLSGMRRNWTEASFGEFAVESSSSQLPQMRERGAEGADGVPQQLLSGMSSPTLVTIDGSTPRLVSARGRQAVQDDSHPPSSVLSTHMVTEEHLPGQPVVSLQSDVQHLQQAYHVRIIMPQPLHGGKLGLVVKHLVVVAITNPKASQLGFHAGDRIAAVNNKPVGSTAEFFQQTSLAMIENVAIGCPVVFDIWRNSDASAGSPSMVHEASMQHVVPLLKHQQHPNTTDGYPLSLSPSVSFPVLDDMASSGGTMRSHHVPTGSVTHVPTDAGNRSGLSRRKTICPLSSRSPFGGDVAGYSLTQHDRPPASMPQQGPEPTSSPHMPEGAAPPSVVSGTRRRQLCCGANSSPIGKQGASLSRRRGCVC